MILWGLCLLTCTCFVDRIHCQNDYIFGQYDYFYRLAIRLVYPLLVLKMTSTCTNWLLDKLLVKTNFLATNYY